MGNILITGINGNVGSFVYDALKGTNEGIVGAVSSISKSKDKFQDPKIKLVEFDFKASASFDGALLDVDRVFLMRPPHIGKPEDLYPFIDAMKKNKIKLVVFLSLMGIEKNPVPPHYKIEKYLENSGLPYCHIRPGFFMQNLTGIHADEIRENDEIFIPAGSSRCSFIDAKDIGFAVGTILMNSDLHVNSAYTITGEESLNYNDISAILSNTLKRKIVYRKPSWINFRHRMIHDRKLDKKMVNVMIMLYFMTRLGTSAKVYNDFHRITGLKARSFTQFAKDNADVWS